MASATTLELFQFHADATQIINATRDATLRTGQQADAKAAFADAAKKVNAVEAKGGHKLTQSQAADGPGVMPVQQQGKWTVDAWDKMMATLSKGDGASRVFGTMSPSRSLRVQCVWIWGADGDIWNGDETETLREAPAHRSGGQRPQSTP